MIWKKETRGSLVNKKLSIICLALCLLVFIPALVTTNAYADDEFTTSVNEKQTVYTGCVYDPDTGYYNYSLYNSQDAVIYSNVLNGVYTNSTVKVGAANSVNYTVFKNGQEYTDLVDGRIVEPGDYAVTVYGNSGQQETVLKFTIVGVLSNLKRMDLPGMCKIERVTLNSEEIPYSTYYVLFEDEGEYLVAYRIANISKLESVRITIDNTPPVITFDGLNEKNEAYGPVKMLEIEDKCTTTITRDGKDIDFSSTLDQSGIYRVTIQDEATNKTIYDFTIYPYYNFSSFVFIGLCVLLLAVVIMYVFFVRKNLRVR